MSSLNLSGAQSMERHLGRSDCKPVVALYSSSYIQRDSVGKVLILLCMSACDPDI